MRHRPHLPTRREFIRDRRRHIRAARKICNELHLGCACTDIFGGMDFHCAVAKMEIALDEMDRITKPLA